MAGQSLNKFFPCGGAPNGKPPVAGAVKQCKGLSGIAVKRRYCQENDKFGNADNTIEDFPPTFNPCAGAWQEKRYISEQL